MTAQCFTAVEATQRPPHLFALGLPPEGLLQDSGFVLGSGMVLWRGGTRRARSPVSRGSEALARAHVAGSAHTLVLGTLGGQFVAGCSCCPQFRAPRTQSVQPSPGPRPAGEAGPRGRVPPVSTQLGTGPENLLRGPWGSEATAVSASVGRPEVPGLGGPRAGQQRALEGKKGVKRGWEEGQEAETPACGGGLPGRRRRGRCARRSLSRGEATGRQKSDKKFQTLTASFREPET